MAPALALVWSERALEAADAAEAAAALVSAEPTTPGGAGTLRRWKISPGWDGAASVGSCLVGCRTQ
eukprot:8941689-Prorocentrum_lima.AAC.1